MRYEPKDETKTYQAAKKEFKEAWHRLITEIKKATGVSRLLEKINSKRKRGKK